MTAGTYNFVSFILSVAFVGLLTAATVGLAPGSASLVALLVITQFSEQVKIRFISQLINGLSSVLQNLLSCFNGTTMSTSFSVFSPCNLLVMLVLESKDFKSLMG